MKMRVCGATEEYENIMDGDTIKYRVTEESK